MPTRREWAQEDTEVAKVREEGEEPGRQVRVGSGHPRGGPGASHLREVTGPNPTSGGRVPTWELRNWQIGRLRGALGVRVLICGSRIRVLAILLLTRGLPLFLLLGHPGEARKGGEGVCRLGPPPPEVAATLTTRPHPTFSARPRCPQSLLPRCPVLL